MEGAKEKAKEIYDKMKGFRVTNHHRKKCALICVNEILESMDNCCSAENCDCVDPEYWQEVKQELSKL